MIGDEDTRIADEVLAERHRQDEKWGEQSLQDGTGPERHHMGLLANAWHSNTGYDPRNLHTARADEITEAARSNCEQAGQAGEATWADVLLEEVFEALESRDLVKLERELEQVSAVAQAWIRDSRRRRGHHSVVPAPKLLDVRMLNGTLNYDRGQLGTIDPDAITDRGLVWVEFGVRRQWSFGESESTGCWCSPFEYEVVPA